jgi:hypothetical protein
MFHFGDAAAAIASAPGARMLPIDIGSSRRRQRDG